MRRQCAQALALTVSIVGLAGVASAQLVTLTPPAVPMVVGPNIQVPGTGYPAGAINAAAVSITVTPSPGNGSPITFAPTVITGAGNSRTLFFKLPASLSANQPYTATIAAAGATTALVPFTTPAPATITINPPTSLANVSPGAGQVGTAVMNVTITGNFTHFAQATSV